jgi:hypothetical protein
MVRLHTTSSRKYVTCQKKQVIKKPYFDAESIYQKLFVGRELRMIDLKKMIAEVEKEIGDIKKPYRHQHNLPSYSCSLYLLSLLSGLLNQCSTPR